MNSNLISKNISGYFDDLINKPIISQPIKQSTMSSFYKNYIEHNLLLIIIIILICLFLLFKYCSKNSDNTEDNKKEKKIKNNNLLKEKSLLKKERSLLEKEKSEILSIIDELSELNYEKSKPNINDENKFENKFGNEFGNKVIFKNKNFTKFDAYTNDNIVSDQYYDINQKKSELIDGVYIETPYN